MGRLAETTLLYSLIIHKWGAEASDKEVSDKVEADNNAKRKAGRYNQVPPG